MKCLCSLLLSLLTVSAVLAQTVDNVDSKQKGDKIEVTYSLSKRADVSAYYSTDDGRHYTMMNSVTGDVGKQVSAGPHKSLLWDVLADTDELYSEAVRFKIDAKKNTSVLKQRFFMSLEFGIPTSRNQNSSIGIMLGKVRKFGWFISGSCGLGVLSQNNTKLNLSSVAIGGMAHITRGLYLHLGPGYSWRSINNSLIDSSTGFAVDVGLSYFAGNFVVNAGTVVSFQYQTQAIVNIGIGFCFNSR